MSKADMMNKYRLEGMFYAAAKIKEKGLEEFAKELEWRSPRGCAITNTKKDIQKYEQDIICRTQDVVLIFALAVLADEFDFSQADLKRFQDRLILKSDCISEKYITWDEQKQILADEYGIVVDFRKRGD